MWVADIEHTAAGRLDRVHERVVQIRPALNPVDLAERAAGDLDLGSAVPMVRISGTIISRTGEATYRQDHPKTARSIRRIVLPEFAQRAVRARVRSIGIAPAERLLFSTRVGTPLATNNIRRQLRDIMDDGGIPDVTPHRFRRTAATAIDETGGLLLAAEFLGHSDPRITVQHYIRRNEAVNPATEDLLDAMFGRAG